MNWYKKAEDNNELEKLSEEAKKYKSAKDFVENFLYKEKIPEGYEIAYHSSNKIISKFDIDKITAYNPSTRINGIFLSKEPQKSFGNIIYKVAYDPKDFIVYDMYHSRFDSLSVQEAFDALKRGETGYIAEDISENYNININKAFDIVEDMRIKKGVILKNVNYAQHTEEIIVFPEGIKDLKIIESNISKQQLLEIYNQVNLKGKI